MTDRDRFRPLRIILFLSILGLSALLVYRMDTDDKPIVILAWLSAMSALIAVGAVPSRKERRRRAADIERIQLTLDAQLKELRRIAENCGSKSGPREGLMTFGSRPSRSD
jgi:hypothetical protein